MSVSRLWCCLKAQGKRGKVNRGQKPPEARESPQTVDEKAEGRGDSISSRREAQEAVKRPWWLGSWTSEKPKKAKFRDLQNSQAHLPLGDGEEFIGGVTIVEMGQAREEHV